MSRKPETMLSMQCTNNPFERAIDVCDECGLPFSNEFLVYILGTRRPPLCKPCAIAMSGVRSSARRQRMPKKEVKRRREAGACGARRRSAGDAWRVRIEMPDLVTIDEAERNVSTAGAPGAAQHRVVRVRRIASARVATPMSRRKTMPGQDSNPTPS